MLFVVTEIESVPPIQGNPTIKYTCEFREIYIVKDPLYGFGITENRQHPPMFSSNAEQYVETLADLREMANTYGYGLVRRLYYSCSILILCSVLYELLGDMEAVNNLKRVIKDRNNGRLSNQYLDNFIDEMFLENSEKILPMQHVPYPYGVNQVLYMKKEDCSIYIPEESEDVRDIRHNLDYVTLVDYNGNYKVYSILAQIPESTLLNIDEYLLTRLANHSIDTMLSLFL